MTVVIQLLNCMIIIIIIVHISYWWWATNEGPPMMILTVFLCFFIQMLYNWPEGNASDLFEYLNYDANNTNFQGNIYFCIFLLLYQSNKIGILF